MVKFYENETNGAITDVYMVEDEVEYCVGSIEPRVHDYIFVCHTNLFNASEFIEIANYLQLLIESQ